MLSSLTARRRPGWMALVSQGGEMALAHVVRDRRARPEVRLLERFSLDGNEGQVLQRLKAARRLKSYRCTTLIGDGEYSLSPVEAPAVPLEERKEALRWLIRDLVSYPVDNACLDVLEIPSEGQPPGRPVSVMVVSAGEAAVRARIAPFAEAGVPLDVIDIPELAQRNVAALLEDDNRGLVFLRIDESGMMLTLTFHGELIAIRRGEMNTRQLNGDDAALRERVLERLVLELQRSLDNFDRQFSHIPVSKVVLAAYPVVENLTEALREAIYLPVHEIDLASVLDFPSIPELKQPQNQARNVLAIGAALRAAPAAGAKA